MNPALIYCIRIERNKLHSKKSIKTYCEEEHLDQRIPFSRSVTAANVSVMSRTSSFGSVCALTVAKI